MRILVTGAEGFVGGHLLAALRSGFPLAEIIGTSRNPAAGEALDITDAAGAAGLFERLQPDFCVHLAGIAAVGAARANPGLAWEVNLQGSLNIAHAILEKAPECRMLFVSSSECYGSSFKSGEALTEAAPLAPMNLYAATKAAAELALGALAGEGLRLLRLRPFNHTGPGQSEDYVVPAFAGQIARIEVGAMPPEIAVGNLAPERDFLDIRDVCAAYVAAIGRFDEWPNNRIFNIASGRPVRIGTILERLLAMANCRIEVRPDKARLRPVEIPRAAGDAGQFQAASGWQVRHELDATLHTVLAQARRLAAPP